MEICVGYQATYVIDVIVTNISKLCKFDEDVLVLVLNVTGNLDLICF